MQEVTETVEVILDHVVSLRSNPGALPQLIVTAAMTQHSTDDADLHVPEDRFVPMVRDLALAVLTR